MVTLTAVEIGLQLIVGGLVLVEYAALKLQVLACQRVIEVHDDLVLAHFLDNGLKVVAVLIGHRHDGAGIDMGFVKLAVDLKYFLLQLQYVLLHEGAVSLIHRHREGKGIAIGLQQTGFKGVETSSEAGDELKRMILAGLLD